MPEEPLVFTKFSTSIAGPGEAIAWDPDLTRAVDLGRNWRWPSGGGRQVRVEEELDHVVGYT